MPSAMGLLNSLRSCLHQLTPTHHISAKPTRLLSSMILQQVPNHPKALNHPKMQLAASSMSICTKPRVQWILPTTLAPTKSWRAHDALLQCLLTLHCSSLSLISLSSANRSL